VTEVYRRAGAVPGYIKGLASNRRKRHYDTLLNIEPLTGRTTYDAWEEDLAVVNIFFGQETATELERSIRQSPVDFISSLGGLFGLCLGFSIISFLELLYWGVVRLGRSLAERHRS
jgi:hypothetical protein